MTIQRPYPWERECGHDQQTFVNGECCEALNAALDYPCPGYITDEAKAAAVVEVIEAARLIANGPTLMFDSEAEEPDTRTLAIRMSDIARQALSRLKEGEGA